MTTGLALLGTGHALPARAVESDALDAAAGREVGWLARASGVRRRFVADEEDQIALATTAARAAMTEAGVGPDDIDLLLFGAAIPYQALPSTAPLLQRALAIPDGRAAAFDVNATCLSFVTALDIAQLQLAAGRHRRALVVSAELASRGLPWQDAPEVAGLFSDGAGAAVVEAAPGRVFASLMRTYPSAWEACQVQAGGTRHRAEEVDAARSYARLATFGMDGKVLFRLTAAHFADFLDALLARAGWRREDIALVIPHQASPGALKHLARVCGFAPGQIADIAAGYGNQIAASIPVTLALARAEGRVRGGDKLLLLGTSAGVSFGGIALEV
ncbi:3-oxoacyl-(acyl-carrier-protein) synthase III [Oceanicola granulosus HTCC2516]|uniref:3-oxoacyl-(Acyl-carrier-protein) synthase III n=1 Tax=Oceanicola granulosus (strain ATCC BAA-861 / DSM 15982 / KCTC 12143 / HTCC2516) TaxID=314256 RepID=Q2CFC1_OCEGH|nr:3-oxoacyl-[acyl-carrier-protein] synthase III C-terminal domain-containing protein [Oceanicola granulosus]EAR51374.1 3-oxoacyl-(acyl-carrier-protein) synthase III [Oceanicola granulosus HTCC2516]